MTFHDHFSEHAAIYAAARPDYPSELFRFLSEQCEGHSLAWDCATGNGQAARGLAHCFERVVASDASSAQIGRATGAPNIEYRVFRAERPKLAESSVDLVTVAQALHWFNLPEFFSAVDRVLRRSGLLAVWSYGLCQVDPACDEVIARLYRDILDADWPPQRRIVEGRYRDIEFPYRKIDPPSLTLEKSWSRAELVAYLHSWSATRRYMARQGEDPVQLVLRDLERAWGGESKKTVVWPLTLIVRRK